MSNVLNNDQIQAAYIKEVQEEVADKAIESSVDQFLVASAMKEGTHFTYHFENVRYKSILSGVTGSLKPGRMTAIMGPSGAGKTTLLKAISGRKKISHGSLRTNKKVLSPSKVRQLSAFVYQENFLIPTLTAHEMLVYTIRIKSREEKSPEQLATSILNILGLGHVSDTMVGDPNEGIPGLSGGEMKRLSIALELISMPSMLFLDEPTSGLDSGTMESVLLYLRKLADRGMIVAVTIHQPSSEVFNMFDDLLLLRKGSLVYGEKVSNCVAYLDACGLPVPEYTNPADHLFRVIDRLPRLDARKQSLSGARADSAGEEEPCQFMRSEGEKKTVDRKRKMSQVRAFFYELRILSKRNLVCSIRNRKYLFAKICQSISLALVTGFFFYNVPGKDLDAQVTNTIGCFGAICMGVYGAFAYGAISILFSDRRILLREYTSNYYFFSSYYAAKVATDFASTCMHPLVAVPFIFFMTKLGSAVHVLACILLGAVGHSLGLLVASLMDNADIALAVFPGIMYPINMLTGAIIDTTTLPPIVSNLQYLSPTRHVFNIMIKTTFTDTMGIEKLEKMTRSFCSISSSFAALTTMYVLIITLSSLCLKYKVKRQSI